MAENSITIIKIENKNTTRGGKSVLGYINSINSIITFLNI